jgi:hypothetical protein
VLTVTEAFGKLHQIHPAPASGRAAHGTGRASPPRERGARCPPSGTRAPGRHVLHRQRPPQARR